jgi:hypothetical protein
MAVKKLILAGQPSNGNLELQGMQSLAQELCVKAMGRGGQRSTALVAA